MPLGGAGGLHSSGIARMMGIGEILVPLAPGILCAQGLISADLTEIFVATHRLPIGDDWAGGPREVFATLQAKALEWFEAGNISENTREIDAQIEMRFIGQNYELAIDMPEIGLGGSAELPAANILRGRFFEAHERNYGHADPGMPVEMVNVRLTARGISADPPVQRKPSVGGVPRPRSRREVWFASDKPLSVDIYDRGALAPGHEISGPAVIEQFDATIVLHPGDTAKVDEVSNITIKVPS
jgi:N-methylhydantoinase A